MTKSVCFKFNLARAVIFIIGFIALWICGDYLYSTFITHNGFTFTVAKDVFMPLIIAIPTAMFTQLLQTE